MNYEAVTPGYLKAAGVPLVQGRDITAADDEKALPVVIVSAATAMSHLDFSPACGSCPVGVRPIDAD